MQYVAVGWTRHGAECYLTTHGTWSKEKYVGFSPPGSGHYHTIPIAVFDTTETANHAVDMSDEITSSRVIELTDDIRHRLTEG